MRKAFLTAALTLTFALIVRVSAIGTIENRHGASFCEGSPTPTARGYAGPLRFAATAHKKGNSNVPEGFSSCIFLIPVVHSTHFK
jgi:hypothetical protein